MDNDQARHKKDFKTDIDWLDRISQQENLLREVYDLLIEFSQQDKPFQLLTPDA
jgi:hypothetical protein